jgi:hypothetical protein
MDDIRIIRLQSGEDLIANYKYNDETGEIILSDPMTILFKRLPTGKSFMMMSPWLPIEIIEDNVAMIFDKDVLTAVRPKKSVINYYKRIALETNIESMEMSSQIEASLSDTNNESYDDEFEEDEIEEYIDSIDYDVPKKQLLH